MNSMRKVNRPLMPHNENLPPPEITEKRIHLSMKSTSTDTPNFQPNPILTIPEMPTKTKTLISGGPKTMSRSLHCQYLSLILNWIKIVYLMLNS